MHKISNQIFEIFFKKHLTFYYQAFVSTVLTGVRYTCGWSLLRYLQSFPGSKNGSKVLLSTAVGVSLETSRTSFCGILPNKQYDN